MFQVIPTRVHGILDYVVGAFIIAAPWAFGFTRSEAAKWTTLSAGSSALLYSMCTNYEMGAFKLLSMNAHLIMDILSGLLLIASPWLFGFADEVWLPHVIIGAVEVITALMTQTSTRRIETAASKVTSQHRIEEPALA